MIVDDLGEAGEAGNDNRRPPMGEAKQYGARSRVGDDEACRADEPTELVEGQKREAGRSTGSDIRGAVLNHDLVIDRELFNCAKHPVERRVAAARRDKDHRQSRTLPTKCACGIECISSGHCA